MTPFEKFKKDFQEKRVLIFGIGLLGRGIDVARTFASIGSHVLATDLKTRKMLRPSLEKLEGIPVELRLGEHRLEDVLNADVLIRNPAVPWHHPLLDRARKKGIPIHMDSSLFARYFPGRIIGITGTRGKTTTTMMIFKLLKNQKGLRVVLAGNATRTANIRLLKNASPDQIAVMELSSWELQGFRHLRVSPHIGVITNIYKDHLNRYKAMEEYVSDKEAIFAFQKEKDYILLNKKNAWTMDMAKRAPSKVIWFSAKDFPSIWTLNLIGSHNRENAAAALKVGRLMGMRQGTMKSVFSRFQPVPHRLETVAELKGVRFINDTTSTTPIATLKALRAISAPTILLVGGNSKNLPLNELAREISKKTKGVLLLRGDGTAKLKKELQRHKKAPILKENLSLEEAIEAAAKTATSGDVVLLSPGFTSFSEFNNEFERGERFKEVVKNLAAKKRKKK